MDNKTMLIIGGILVIVLAIIFKDRVKAAFMGLTVDTDNRKNKNQLDITGEQNKVRQGKGTVTGDVPTSNRANIAGNSNEIDQG